MQTNKKPLIGVIAAALLAGAGYGLYRLGVQRAAPVAATGGTAATAPMTSGSPQTAAVPQTIAEGEAATRRHIEQGLKAGQVDPKTGQPILYYQDPMVPGKRFDSPAKSPFMDMMLVPVYGGAGADASQVTVSPRIQQNLGVRTALVTEGMLSPQVSAVGSIAWNERDQFVLQARAMGYVEKLHVRATLDRVAKGQPIAELYVPDWVAAQEEFLSLRRSAVRDDSLVAAARQRMRLVGMSEGQIAEVERAGVLRPRLTLSAPAAGVVSELAVREGMTVAPGALLARINGLATVWAVAEVPEAQAALLRPGTRVEARSPGAPGTVFRGTVQAVLPEVSAATRTIKARVELENPGYRLVPGMFATMQFIDQREEKALLVPTEALIQTGKRTVVLLAEEGGRFTPVEVEAGLESGGQSEVRRGLTAGQRVVVSAQFLIDSEASLKGVEARLNDAPKPGAANTAERHRGTARIEAIGRDSFSLSHGAIASIKWAAMTMDFKAPPAKDIPRGLEPGDRVDFEFYLDAQQGPQLTFLTLLPPDSPAAEASGARP